MKGRSREQVRAQGEVGQWCEPGQARGELQSEHCSRVFPLWAEMSGLVPHLSQALDAGCPGDGVTISKEALCS